MILLLINRLLKQIAYLKRLKIKCKNRRNKKKVKIV